MGCATLHCIKGEETEFEVERELEWHVGGQRVTCENVLSSGVDEGHLGIESLKPSLGYSSHTKE